jgi:hypothetical protein
VAVAVERPFGTGRLQHAAGFGLPAGLLALALLLAIPRTLVGARLGVHILFFIFARDAMSPAGFWQLGAGSKRLTAPAPSVLWGVLGGSGHHRGGCVVEDGPGSALAAEARCGPRKRAVLTF